MAIKIKYSIICALASMLAASCSFGTTANTINTKDAEFALVTSIDTQQDFRLEMPSERSTRLFGSLGAYKRCGPCSHWDSHSFDVAIYSNGSILEAFTLNSDGSFCKSGKRWHASVEDMADASSFCIDRRNYLAGANLGTGKINAPKPVGKDSVFENEKLLVSPFGSNWSYYYAQSLSGYKTYGVLIRIDIAGNREILLRSQQIAYINYVEGSFEKSGNSTLYFCLAHTNGQASLQAFSMRTGLISEVFDVPTSNMAIVQKEGKNLGIAVSSDKLLSIDLASGEIMAKDLSAVNGYESMPAQIIGGRDGRYARIGESGSEIVEILLFSYNPINDFQEHTRYTYDTQQELICAAPLD
ncbi:MAG: hypothetical protein FWG10_07115 [Eubacteriaceae bacterium]|nr:hypothetical protein [Eubacteriaceae bacterium]